ECDGCLSRLRSLSSRRVTARGSAAGLFDRRRGMDDKRNVPALAAGFPPVDQIRARVPVRHRLREPWLCVFLLAGGVLAALYLATIGSDPPGLYDDEANIGYNAWTIAHYGVDQY